MKYLDNTEQAIGTLTYRISQLERRINETIEPEMKQTGKSLLALRQELAAGRILFKEEGRKDAAAVVAGMRSWRDIVVPPQLMIGKTTKRRGLKRSGGRNRTAQRAEVSKVYAPVSIPPRDVAIAAAELHCQMKRNGVDGLFFGGLLASIPGGIK